MSLPSSKASNGRDQVEDTTNSSTSEYGRRWWWWAEASRYLCEISVCTSPSVSCLRSLAEPQVLLLGLLSVRPPSNTRPGSCPGCGGHCCQWPLCSLLPSPPKNGNASYLVRGSELGVWSCNRGHPCDCGGIDRARAECEQGLRLRWLASSHADAANGATGST